jgi:hypothetical protein
VTGADAETLRLALADLGPAFEGRFAELVNRPSADKAERLASDLEGARLAVLRYRGQLLAEGEGDGR